MVLYFGDVQMDAVDADHVAPYSIERPREREVLAPGLGPAVDHGLGPPAGRALLRRLATTRALNLWWLGASATFVLQACLLPFYAALFMLLVVLAAVCRRDSGSCAASLAWEAQQEEYQRSVEQVRLNHLVLYCLWQRRSAPCWHQTRQPMHPNTAKGNHLHCPN